MRVYCTECGRDISKTDWYGHYLSHITWTRVTTSYDGTANASDVYLYVDRELVSHESLRKR